MTGRVLGLVTAVIVVVVLGCSGLLVTLLSGAASSAACTPAAPPSASSAPPAANSTHAAASVEGFTAEQVANATAIVAVGQRMAVPARGWVIAVATAIQESSLINTGGGDRDSVGLFQQRPSQGWGTAAQLSDPQYAATQFYTKLLAVPEWQTMPLTDAAQRVQISAYPDAYAKHEPAATQLVAAITGMNLGGAGCAVTISALGWTHPAPGATLGSGFRTADRPGHDGVDLIAGKGTLIRAAAAGTVSRVRCNAIDTRTGGEWGCDRDGDPELTAGCGWYVDIDHDGFVTRYCHMLTQPQVSVGQPVNPGDVIGIVGSSGHSSGPHLHFEVHRGSDHTAASAIDAAAHMRSVGAPLT